MLLISPDPGSSCVKSEVTAPGFLIDFKSLMGRRDLQWCFNQTTSVVCVGHQAERKIFSEIDKILTKQILRKMCVWFLFEGVYASKQILNSAGHIMIVRVYMCVCGSVTGKALGTQLSVEAFGKKQTSNVVLGCLGIFLRYCSTCIWKTTGKNRTGLQRNPLKSLKHTWTPAVWTTLNQNRSDHVEQVHMLKILDSNILQSIWYYFTMFVCPTKKVTTQETAHVQLVSDLSARGLVTCAICEGKKILATYTPRAMLSILLLGLT